MANDCLAMSYYAAIYHQWMILHLFKHQMTKQSQHTNLGYEQVTVKHCARGLYRYI